MVTSFIDILYFTTEDSSTTLLPMKTTNTHEINLLRVPHNLLFIQDPQTEITNLRQFL